MLDNDYRHELKLRLARTECRVQVPRALEHRFRTGLRSSRPPNERRRFQRFSFAKKVLLQIESTVAGIERKPEFFTVFMLDLCRSGVAFLHCQELFPGEIPVVWFEGGKVRCQVARCLRHNARCFEIGASFEGGPQSPAWLRGVTRPLKLAEQA
jgi:hypothetical protein